LFCALNTYFKKSRASGVVQVVEHLPSKREALSSDPKLLIQGAVFVMTRFIHLDFRETHHAKIRNIIFKINDFEVRHWLLTPEIPATQAAKIRRIVV
jgi:hypothetical protein